MREPALVVSSLSCKSLHAHLAINPSIMEFSEQQQAGRKRGSISLHQYFLHSVSMLGHHYLMLTFSPDRGMWLFYEIAHCHLFHLKRIRQRLHFM